MDTTVAAEAPVADSVFLRMPRVRQITGLGRSTIYRLMKAHRFPAPYRLAERAVAWKQTDIDQWSAARPQQKA